MSCRDVIALLNGAVHEQGTAAVALMHGLQKLKRVVAADRWDCDAAQLRLHHMQEVRDCLLWQPCRGLGRCSCCMGGMGHHTAAVE